MIRSPQDLLPAVVSAAEAAGHRIATEFARPGGPQDAGGDTDTNAAICGALLGAAAGRAAFPGRWVMPVLACRPLRALGARQPRPATYWPDDLPDLAEALLMRRLAGDPA